MYIINAHLTYLTDNILNRVLIISKRKGFLIKKKKGINKNNGLVVLANNFFFWYTYITISVKLNL